MGGSVFLTALSWLPGEMGHIVFILTDNIILCHCQYMGSYEISQVGPWLLNTLMPRQNSCHFVDSIFKSIFLKENIWISIDISQKFIPKGQINNIPALGHIMAWCRPVASFTKEVNSRLCKRPLVFNGRLANRRLTSCGLKLLSEPLNDGKFTDAYMCISASTCSMSYKEIQHFLTWYHHCHAKGEWVNDMNQWMHSTTWH